MPTLIARDGNKFIAAARGELNNPILLILRDKGYELSISFHPDDPRISSEAFDMTDAQRRNQS